MPTITHNEILKITSSEKCKQLLRKEKKNMSARLTLEEICILQK